MLTGISLREIVLRLGCRAAGELDVNDGVETTAEQRLGRLLHDLGIGQALPRRAQCGVGAVQREICAGHVEDQLLMRRGERHVAGDRKLTRRFDRGCAAAEIKQQIIYGELRVYFLGVEDDEALRYEVAGKREYDVLPADDRARRQGRKISGARDADIDCRLPRLFPGDARRRVAALGDIDQLDERIEMVGVDVGGRRQLDCRVFRHREPPGPDGAGAGAAGASLDGSNCHGVSGEAGAKSRVSLQAPSNAHPARAMRRNLAGGMQCTSDRRRGHRLRLRTNLVENFADVLVQHAVPCRESREVITRAGEDRRFR